MASTWIQQGLIVVLATLVSGCSTWTGPGAMVEDRSVPSLDRPRTAASKTTGGASVSETANRKGTRKPQREERLVTATGSRDLKSAKEDTGINAKAAKEISSPGAPASADAMSADYQVLDMKPQKPSSGSLR